MKKILTVCILSSILLSCINLDRDPFDAFPADTFFTSKEAALSNLAAVYQSTQMGGYFDNGNALFMDNISDNAYCPFANQLTSFIAVGSATPYMKGLFVDVYRGFFNYVGIRNANYFLANIDKVPMLATEKEQMKAEVRFLRAFNYARKMMCFGGVPLVTTVLEYGEENKIPRSSEAEICSFVTSELAAVSLLLPIDRPTPELGRITKGAALALKARVELFTKDYKNAALDAKAVMDLNKYDLFNDYEGLFWEKNQGLVNRDKEVVLEVRYKAPINPSDLSPIYSALEGGWNSVNPTQSIVDAYETLNGKSISDDPSYNENDPYKNRDPRLAASIIFPGQSWNGRIFNSLQIIGKVDEFYNSSQGNRSRTGYCLRKYCAPLSELQKNSVTTSQSINYTVIRYAEVLLIYAEALIEQDQNLDLAAAAINKVRSRVNMPNLTETDQNGLRKRVRNERRVELAFEGFRWYDMKRWNIAGEVMNGSVYGVRPGTVNMTTGVVTFTSPNHIVVGNNRVFDVGRDYYFPIPQEDIDVNPALRGHQNPKW